VSDTIERIRKRYRPERIITLFVGESAPESGKFFYSGTTPILIHMQTAVEAALGKNGDFLQRFKAYGWYLDDLVLNPVDKLPKSQREALCIGAMKVWQTASLNTRQGPLYRCWYGLGRLWKPPQSWPGTPDGGFLCPFRAWDNKHGSTAKCSTSSQRFRGYPSLFAFPTLPPNRSTSYVVQ
jgi:hypothetical protein